MWKSKLTACVVLATGAFATAVEAKVPFFNAVCPGQIEVHADEGGPVYVGGKETKLKRFNDNYYEARLGALTISVTIRPDGSPDISYTGKGRANGVCQITSS
jgi:hypothetical protein